MSVSKSSPEIPRLIDAFEVEASKFHNIRLSRFLVTQSGPSVGRKFDSMNHAIMLWQYYGAVDVVSGAERFANDIGASDLQWGLRGAEISSFAVVEGQACDLFVRMAQRAGSLFDKSATEAIERRVVDEILAREQSTFSAAKPTAVTNSNPLAVWINFLLYHLSMTHPGRELACQIEPDPFSLSLLALERLAADQTIGKVDRSGTNIAEIKFKVAMSFPGERRAYVSEVVDILRDALGSDAIFYDFDYQAQLARPNLDTLLQDVYRNRSQLVVVFLCAEYAQKQWCGLEWRAVRDIIKNKDDERVLLVRFDSAQIDGVLSIDGYLDARSCAASDVATSILERLSHLPEEA